MKMARYTAAFMRRMAVETAPCFHCHRARVRADLEQCRVCCMMTCDRCAGRCFCADSERVIATARTLSKQR